MKRVLCFLIAGLLLCATLLSTVGCDGKDVPEGTYILESGETDRMFVFSEELLVMVQAIGTETVEFHYTYEISEDENGAESLILTYKGLVYGGRDPDVSWYLTGMREQYAKNPTVVSKLERGDGYLVINGQKFVKM